MCYSAQVWAEYRKYEREYGAALGIQQYVRFFWERRRDGTWRKIPKRMKSAFAHPRDDAEREIQAIIAQGDAELECTLQADEGKRVTVPMRYQCRLPSWNEIIERKFPGTYNARRDGLEKTWAKLFGYRHGIMVVNAFYENVPKHKAEHRELGPGERDRPYYEHRLAA